MANQTILLQGLTSGAAVGDDAIAGALDITPAVLGVKPELRVAPTTERFFSSLVATVVEGKAKYLINVKAHINKYGTTRGMYTGVSVGGDIDKGEVNTTGFKKSKKQPFEFTLDKSWDAGQAYDKKKDPKVQEGQLIEDAASLLFDLREEKSYSFYDAINNDVVATAGETSKLYPTYVSSRDNKTVASPALVSEVAIDYSVATEDELEFEAAKLIDHIWSKVEEQAKFGRKGNTHEGFPFVRGTRDSIGAAILMGEEARRLASHDKRFIQTGSAEQMINGKVVSVLGTIDGVPVVQDDAADENSNFQVSIIPTGSYGVVAVVQELADEMLLFPHPTKPTRLNLLEGSGAWDTHVTPWILLARFILIKDSSAAGNAGGAGN